MTEPLSAEACEQASISQRTAAPPSRSMSLLHGTLSRPRTVTLLTALVLGLIATLVGPLGSKPAHAADGNPIFRVGTDHGYDYVNFINSIRARMNDGGTDRVPGAGNAYRVNHTNTSLMPGTSYPRGRDGHDAYLQVDVQMWGNPNHVRLQLRRADLYILGWWDSNNVYHYMGNRGVPQAERERHDGSQSSYRDANSIRQTFFDENYVSMETNANERRANMAISMDTISGAAWYLYAANNNENMARGVLRMAQFISEAARFRPLRDNIASVIGVSAVHHIPPQFVSQEQNWARLSGRFNWLLGFDQGYRDPNPLTGYRRDMYGDAVQIVLYTAVQYAQYVLGTSKGRN